MDAGEVVSGADTGGGFSCCGETVGGPVNVTGSNARIVAQEPTGLLELRKGCIIH